MGIKGLKEYQKYNEEKEARRKEAEANRLDWFSLQDGQSVKIRPLQELDEDSPNYSAKNGRGFIAVEHVNPKDFKNKALCTAEEGACVGCEQHVANRNVEGYKGAWKQKTRMYLNVLVDNSKDDPYVVVLSQGTGPKAVTPTLIEYAGETGSITNRWWKVTRKGAGLSDTSYTIMAFDPKDDVDVEAYELQDLNRAVRTVPYEEQEAHYHLGAEPKTETQASSASVSDESIW